MSRERQEAGSLQPEHFQLVAEVDSSHWWFVGRRRILRSLLAAVLDVPNGRGGSGPRTDSEQPVVVDVGCGPGANIASLSDIYQCIGIDTSVDAIDLARQRFDTTDFILGSTPELVADTLPGGADDVDAFLLMDVLEHVDDDRALLAAFVNAAAPGTHVLITVPADMKLWSEQDVNLGHFRRYDTDSLRSVWADLPVSEVMMSHFNTRLYPIVRVIRFLSRITGRSFGDEGSDMQAGWQPTNSLLTRIFAGESQRLVGVLAGDRRGYPRGVSLVAILERTPG